jgi:hypothetical protein
VGWVNSVVQYHKQRTLEKTLLDLCLQCIYSILFPSPSSPLSTPLAELEKIVTTDLSPKAPAILLSLRNA